MTAVIKQEKLPQLYNSVLDEGQLFKLFQDIHACTDVLSVLSKPKPGQCVTRIHMDLNQAYQMLLSNEVRGVQIRYLYDRLEWWDTILVDGLHYKIVRISHPIDRGQE
ncbi:MAG: hypothetical protein ACOX5R_00700 [bacterium]|jgi:hypothetical protein